MDAREQLRRYLEQRRELGETELVLDTLTVDETLRILGAPAGAARPSEPSRAQSDRQRAPAPDTGDWREALRATGAGPADIQDRRFGPGYSRIAERNRPLLTRRRKPSNPTLQPPRRRRNLSRDAAADAGDLRGLSTIDAVAKHIAACTRCALYATATNSVPGEGNPSADFMCVGEAPGATEDETGRPFIGAAGQLLTKILGRDRSAARRRVHLQRPQTPTAGEPESAARGSRRVQSVPRAANRARSAEGHTRARHFCGSDTPRHQAAHR